VRGRRTEWDGSEANPDASRSSDALDQLHYPDLRFWVIAAFLAAHGSYTLMTGNLPSVPNA
jgi:hypothetical protein